MLEGDKIRGRYKIIKELGAGGMSNIYLANDYSNDEKVVLKVSLPLDYFIREDIYSTDPRGFYYLFKERLKLESEFLANLKHPNIPEYIEDFELDGEFVMVIPYIDGKTLGDIYTSNPGNPYQVMKQINQIIDVLSYLHSQNIIHRDIKPQNILVESYSDKVYLIDFGTAKKGYAGLSTQNVTRINVDSGGYTAPEVRSEKSAFPQSDIYSLAKVIYFCLYGDKPSSEMIPPIGSGNLKVILDALSMATHNDPKKRQASISEFGDSLNNVSTIPPGPYIIYNDRRVPLLKDNIYIGRANNMDITIPDDNISRRHAFIIKKESKYILYDNASKNGTWVYDKNDESFKKIESYELEDNEIFSLGYYEEEKSPYLPIQFRINKS